MSSTLPNSISADSGVTGDVPGVTVDGDGGPVGTYSWDQYSQAARQLLPPGRAWNAEDGSDQALYCDALGMIFAQQDADSVQMLANFFPATATEGIAEWNSSLGLPDSCMGPPANQAANQQQIVSRFISTGGQSIAYYQQIATALGFEISITEFSPTEPGGDAPPGMIVESSDWAHTWRVNILNVGVAPASSLLQCLLERYKPAHTQFYIVIGSSPSETTRLFDVSDNVSDGLLIEIMVR